MTTILHVIQQLNLGGAARALIAASKYSSRLGAFQHRVVSLLPSETDALELARAGGLTVCDVPDRPTILREMASADIVQIHWWNTPQLQSLLRGELPATRLLLWYHVAGDGSPQIITPELVKLADLNNAVLCRIEGHLVVDRVVGREENLDGNFSRRHAAGVALGSELEILDAMGRRVVAIVDE